MVHIHCKCGNAINFESQTKTMVNAGKHLTTILVFACEKCGTVHTVASNPMEIAKIEKKTQK